MEQIIKSTPILQHFAESKLSLPHHFNQSVMVKAKRHLNMFTFNATLQVMCQYHDMLRAVWNGSQLILPEPTTRNPFHLEVHNLKNSTDINADINALLLTALSRAWKEATDCDVLSLAQEGHGREPFGRQPLALERLVGWFTSIFPVALTYTSGDIGQHVSAVNNMLHNIPNKGLGYGILRHTTHHNELKCSPLMTFNYLGSFDESQTDSFFTIDNTLPQGESVSRENKNDTPLSINCAVADGCLAGTLLYDRGIIDEDTAGKVCEYFVNNMKSMNFQVNNKAA